MSVFKHLTLSIGFDKALNEKEVSDLLQRLKSTTKQKYNLLTYFVLNELTSEHKDEFKA